VARHRVDKHCLVTDRFVDPVYGRSDHFPLQNLCGNVAVCCPSNWPVGQCLDKLLCSVQENLKYQVRLKMRSRAVIFLRLR